MTITPDGTSDVWPANKLISAADAVTAVPPTFQDPAVRFGAIADAPVSALCNVLSMLSQFAFKSVPQLFVLPPTVGLLKL